MSTPRAGPAPASPGRDGGGGSSRPGLQRTWSDGTRALLFSPMELVERLAAIVPPPRINQITFRGVLAAHASWRPEVVPPPRPESPEAARHPGEGGDLADEGASGGQQAGAKETLGTVSPGGTGAADGRLASEDLTPAQREKHAKLAERDAAATEKRRVLFQANIDSVDAAIEKAEAEGGNPEYIAALRQRRALLVENADSEAEAEGKETETAASAAAGGRVDRGVTSPAPHRSGRADLPHPALRIKDSLHFGRPTAQVWAPGAGSEP